MRNVSLLSPPSRSFKEGSMRPINKMSRYPKQGAAGEVRTLLPQWFDLPGRAESKVALHLIDRRGHPSSKEGNRGFSRFFHSLTPSMGVDRAVTFDIVGGHRPPLQLDFLWWSPHQTTAR